MDTPPVDSSPRMFCCKCGYALVGLPSNRCPECGRDFDLSNPKSFLTRQPRVVLRRIIYILVILFCLTLPADCYLGSIVWHAREEMKAIRFLKGQGFYVHSYNATPHWARVFFRGHADWLWERADYLEIGPSPDRDLDARIMAAASGLKSLKSLTMCDFPVTDGNMLRNMTTLQQLDLAACQLNDGVIEHLNNLKSLQWLDLQMTRVTDSGLSHLKNVVSLRYLYLSDTGITDVGMTHLKGLTALQYLDLSSTNVTDAGIIQLKDITTLQILWLYHTQVTDLGVAELHRRLPNCTILVSNGRGTGRGTGT